MMIIFTFSEQNLDLETKYNVLFLITFFVVVMQVVVKVTSPPSPEFRKYVGLSIITEKNSLYLKL